MSTYNEPKFFTRLFDSVWRFFGYIYPSVFKKVNKESKESEKVKPTEGIEIIEPYDIHKSKSAIPTPEETQTNKSVQCETKLTVPTEEMDQNASKFVINMDDNKSACRQENCGYVEPMMYRRRKIIPRQKNTQTAQFVDINQTVQRRTDV